MVDLHGHLLHQMVSCDRHALAHEDLVTGAAQADHVDAGRAVGVGELEQRRVLRGSHDDVGQHRVVTVHGDVDLVPAQDAEVDR